MINISVKADIASARAQLLYLQNTTVGKAAAHALNRTAGQVRSAAVKAVAQRTGVKQKDVRRAMRITVRATPTGLTAVIQATGRTWNLIRLGARQVAKGVSYRAWGRRHLAEGAFIANKGRTVFQRMPGEYMRNRKGETKHSEAIEPVYGPSIPRSMASKAVGDLMRRIIGERWPINFAADLRYFLRK